MKFLNSLNVYEKANVLVTLAGSVITAGLMLAGYVLGDKGSNLRMKQQAETMRGYLNPPSDKP